MKSNSFINSKIFKIFDYIFRLVLINLLIFIPSFLLLYLFNLIFEKLLHIELASWQSLLLLIPTLLYFFPSLATGADLIRRYELKETNGLFKEFFKSFKRLYFRTLLEEIIIIIIGGILSFSALYFYNHYSEGLIFIFGLVISIGFLIIFICIVIHLLLVVNYMQDLSIIQDFKLAAMMAFKELPITLLLCALTVGCGYLALNFDLVAIMGAFSLPLYLIVKLSFKKYYLIYIRTIKPKEE